jgi:hypothetical protein
MATLTTTGPDTEAFDAGTKKFASTVNVMADSFMGFMYATGRFGALPPHHGIEFDMDISIKVRRITLAEWFERYGFRLYAPK